MQIHLKNEALHEAAWKMEKREKNALFPVRYYLLNFFTRR